MLGTAQPPDDALVLYLARHGAKIRREDGDYFDRWTTDGEAYAPFCPVCQGQVCSEGAPPRYCYWCGAAMPPEVTAPRSRAAASCDARTS